MLVRMTLPLSAAHSPATPTPSAASSRDASGSDTHAPRPRRAWTPEDKAECLALFASSGLSAAAFAREMDIPEATFALWRRQAREAALVESAGDGRDDAGDEGREESVSGRCSARFAAVQLVEPPPTPPPPTSPSTLRARSSSRELGLVLRWPNGVTAELTGLDGATAGALVRELAASWAPAATDMARA